MSGSQDEIPPPPPPPPPSSSQTPTQQTPHTVSTIKLPILKKGEYDIWAMKMKHYLAHTDYPIWEDHLAYGFSPEYHLAKFQRLLMQKRCGMPSNPDLGGNETIQEDSELPSLDQEDLDRFDENALEEIYLKWQVAMISMRMKKFYKKTGRKLQFDAKEPVGFDKTKVECYNCHKTVHFAKECKIKGNQDKRQEVMHEILLETRKNRSRTGKKEDSKALVTIMMEKV
ncbi:ribonuclease H-like domain-containing protein [Tanacetum coccineum]